MQDQLVRFVLPMPDKEGRSCKYHGDRRQVCNLIEETSTFSYSTTNETFKITKGPLNYSSMYVVYLMECKVCVLRFPYT